MTNTVNIELELSNNHFDEFFRPVFFSAPALSVGFVYRLGNRNELHARKF